MYAYKYIVLYMLKLNLIHKYIITFELDLGVFFFFLTINANLNLIELFIK